jgi:hypothetical protein
VSGFTDVSGPVAVDNFIDAGGLASPGDTYYLISIE